MNNKQKELITIVIPIYSKLDIVRNGLQKLRECIYIDKVKIHLVDDCSPNITKEEVDLLINDFKDLNIKYDRLNENVGQGLARQYGIDNCTTDLIMFMDEDDYYTKYGIKTLLDKYNKGLKKYKSICAVFGGHICRKFDGELNDKEINMITIWAKLYNTKFFKNDKYQIKFVKEFSRRCEDIQFSSRFFMLCSYIDSDAKILTTKYKVYKWNDNDNSQTAVWGKLGETKYNDIMSAKAKINTFDYLKSLGINEDEFIHNTIKSITYL